MAERNQDEMLREAAKARGFRLVKSRRRKAGGDFGKYGLTDLKSGRECFGFGEAGLTGTAEEVLAYLRGGEVASWKRSLLGVVEGGKGRDAASTRKGRSTPIDAAALSPGQDAKGGRSATKSRRGASLRRAENEEPRPRGKAKKDSSSAVAEGAGDGSSSAEAKSPALSIRPATRRDAAALGKLIGVETATLAERLAAAIRAGEAPVVAERDAIVGVVAWTVIPLLDEAPRGRITLLHVTEGERRDGIGSRLLGEAETQLAEAGVTRVELLLGIDLDAPSAFLRRTGWERATNGYGKVIG